MENVLIKIVSLMGPMNCAPHVEMDSESMQMEIVNSLIPIVSLLLMEDAMLVPKDGIQVQEETVSDFQPTASSVMSSLKDLVPNV